MALGFIMVFGAVGGMDNTPGYLLEQISLAVVGLLLMLWATKSLTEQ
jgi:hypothetical protein